MDMTQTARLLPSQDDFLVISSITSKTSGRTARKNFSCAFGTPDAFHCHTAPLVISQRRAVALMPPNLSITLIALSFIWAV